MYIAIEGVIGVGKTTLARLIKPIFNANLLLEVFEENPFLSDFYSDRSRYAFQTQMFFLLSRYQQQRHGVNSLMQDKDFLLSDYTFDKDALFARINLEGDELDMYHRVHLALAEKTLCPDLIIYLRADTDVLMQRISMRDRSFERQMERSYIEELNQEYERYFLGSTACQSHVLPVDTNQRNFIQDQNEVEKLADEIRRELKLAPYQPSLPINS